METVVPSTNTTRLYALQLCLRPLRSGTLMPFSGELVHGAFLSWLRAAAPEVASWLHEGQKRRFFTCSSLQFDRPAQAMLKAERENIHLPLHPDKTYTARLTLLLNDLLPLFHEALAPFDGVRRQSNSRVGAASLLHFGKQQCKLEEVIISNDGVEGATGYASLASLVDQAARINFPRYAALTLEFTSLTAFSRGHKRIGYGSHAVMLPLPELVFSNLARRWEDLAPPDLAGLIERERLEQYIQEDGVIIVDYHLKAHRIHLTTHQQPG